MIGSYLARKGIPPDLTQAARYADLALIAVFGLLLRRSAASARPLVARIWWRISAAFRTGTDSYGLG